MSDLTRDQINQIVAEYNHGMGLSNLAQHWRIGLVPLRKLLIREGVTIRDFAEATALVREIRRQSPERRAKAETVVHFYREGVPIQVIMDMLEVPPRSLYRYLREAGVPKRNPYESSGRGREARPRKKLM